MIDRSFLWAKLRRTNDNRIIAWHSLVAHSADVAAVLLALLKQPTIAARLATLAERPALTDLVCVRLGALAFLHDLGKANRGFRARVDTQALKVGHIDQVAWLLRNAHAPTEHLVQVLGLDRLQSWFATEDDGDELLSAVFAHHGRPWAADDPPPSAQHWEARVDGDPIGMLASVRIALDEWFPGAFLPGPVMPAQPGFVHAFAGWLMLADWLGSGDNFSLANGQDDAGRWTFARAVATSALREVGLDVEASRASVLAAPISFARAFDVDAPRPVQAGATGPTAKLVVIEAETGSGKTEAALWRFKHLFEQGIVDGLYFALPTRVAATQIHARVMAFRDRVFGPIGPMVVLAVPGQVLADKAQGHPLPEFDFEWSDDPGGGINRARWTAEHPKRFLAAQIAVGTIDQALLGTVRTRHAHLRGSTLLRNLLVVDEVHASDRYMGDLLTALLRSHNAAGGHALLLSATLGAGLRATLLNTPCPGIVDAEQMHYPLISWAEAGVLFSDEVKNVGQPKHVQVFTEPLLARPDAIAARALAAAEQGAAVLVIRNTVRDAVATARAIEQQAGMDCSYLFRVTESDDPTLHHGQFAGHDRRLLDRAVERALGRHRADGGRIVVGTQTLEQSLDLDADLLLTDLCPIDVLLQRIGRLHRHVRCNRSAGYRDAQAIVLVPSVRNLLPWARGLGAYGKDRAYPDLRILELTWRLILDRQAWVIPTMNRSLVERGTHPECLAALVQELSVAEPGWKRHALEREGTEIAHSIAARYALLDRTAPFSEFRLCPDEHLSARLGLLDRQVVLDGLGPFGAPPGPLRIPSWLLGGVGPEVMPEDVVQNGPALQFRMAKQRFRYDRFGLVASSEP